MRFKELPGRIFAVTVMIMLALILLYLDYYVENLIIFGYLLNNLLVKGYLSLIALAIIYLIFKLIFEGAFIGSVKEYKTRYSLKKAGSALYYAGCIIALTSIWVEDLTSLFLAFGLVGAGIAIALQDLFRNFAGAILILTGKIYSVGDRVEIDHVIGDVLDIGVFYTTLMEIRGWVSGDQASGRISIIPNGRVLSGSTNNYTKDHPFLWDEITVPVTYSSDWKMASEKFVAIAMENTKHTRQQAEESILKIRDKYYAEQVRNLDPAVFIRATDNWIEISVRYTVDVYERRKILTSIHQGILEEVARNDKIMIASATFEIVGFPEIKMKSKGDSNA